MISCCYIIEAKVDRYLLSSALFDPLTLNYQDILYWNYFFVKSAEKDK